jgi:hypothetical protein
VSLIAYSNRKGDIQLIVKVTNTLNFNRTEVVALSRTTLTPLLQKYPETTLKIKKQGETEYVVTQWIDNNQDGVNDELLFQAHVAPNSEAKYIVVVDDTSKTKTTNVVAYSRFVPERTDDYTWENDKVAFRTYGPDAQRRIEEQEEDGTLSSGIDLWLKRVDYAIIDKWYSKNMNEPGYYHTDRGEGHDPYHVGTSRGTGGIGVWENDSLYVSKNFTTYNRIAKGPLRTVFELSYAPWSPYQISETKKITLDLGSNFSKFEVALQSEFKVPNYTVGITLHNNKGKVKLNKEQGWFRYWEPMVDSFVGEGIVMSPKAILNAKQHISTIPDQSQLLIMNKATDTLTYYAGFAWTKSKQVSSVKEWDAILEHQKQIIENRLIVSVKE